AAILAAAFVASASTAAFQALFAVSILVAVAMSVLAPRFKPTAPRVALAGVISGLMGTLTGVGAPPFAIALQNAPAGQLRATMNAVLLLGAILSMGALTVFGAFGLADILRGASLIPAAIAGFWTARFIIRDPRTASLLRPAVLGLCALSSVALLVRAVLTG
ncbi:MAG: TSUP family transporter, partial [Pseudomonadota bacterium]